MKNLFAFSVLLFTSALLAQEPLTVQNGCNFEGDETETEYYTFETSNEADKIVKSILSGVDISYESILVKEANVKNALATTLDKRRYILYSTAFLEKFKGDAKTRWAAYTVLAHEIGHHLNGHDFAEKDPKARKKMELQADKFAGGVCRTLGATLEEALAGMESMKLEGETATHPPKSARTAAIASGWKSKDELLGGGVRDTILRINNPDACANCQGEGTVVKKVKCSVCDGKGLSRVIEKCQKCDGEGKSPTIKCHMCEGRGYYPGNPNCYFCSGTGKKFNKPCSDCKGTGKKNGPVERKLCNSCDGTGKDICSYCQRKGSISKGKEKCKNCDGTGLLDERESCNVCKGSGKKKKP